jgi:perosamine synthetase
LIRVCEPSLSDLEKKYVCEAIDKSWLSSIAPPVRLFEEAFAQRWGTKHAVAVNSGGSALFLALWALGIRDGDEVLMPAFTMIATAGAVTQCGATPVFVDSEPGTGNIDVSLIQEKITTRTKMILPVHIYGHPCDMDPILKLARDYGLFLVEDAAESHGALYKGKQVGALGHAGCFSFYANKVVTSGEGGMIITNDDNLAHRLRHARAYDFDEERHFWHKRLAWNLRMSALEAAVGRAQLERLDELIAGRRRNAAYYTERLGDLAEPLETKDYATPICWMYGLLVRDLAERNGLMDHLAKNGVETRTFFLPMHQQPVYKSAESFPVAENLGERGLYLPSSSHLRDEDREAVVRHVREYLVPRR